MAAVVEVCMNKLARLGERVNSSKKIFNSEAKAEVKKFSSSSSLSPLKAEMRREGTVIDQGEAPDFYFQKYPEDNPVFGLFTWRWVVTLGFDHMFSSPHFSWIVRFLGSIHMACVIQHRSPWLRLQEDGISCLHPRPLGSKSARTRCFEHQFKIWVQFLREADMRCQMPNSRLPIEIDRMKIVILDAIGSSGLDLKTDPGVPVLYTGFGALMLTTCISYLSHSQIRTLQDGTAVIVGGKTNREKAEFPSEINPFLNRVPELVESSKAKQIDSISG